jgi:hypothetical protein
MRYRVDLEVSLVRLYLWGGDEQLCVIAIFRFPHFKMLFQGTDLHTRALTARLSNVPHWMPILKGSILRPHSTRRKRITRIRADLILLGA